MKTRSLSMFKYHFRAPDPGPCHRVARGDGSIAGCRRGVERKRALLASEAAEAVELTA